MIGLYRDEGPIDFLWSVAAFPVSRLIRKKGNSRAPLKDPVMTLPEIRAQADRLLPGAIFRRHLLWRYTLLWKRP